MKDNEFENDNCSVVNVFKDGSVCVNIEEKSDKLVNNEYTQTAFNIIKKWVNRAIINDKME